MYKKIMVPLDGSELAECVLPHVETFITGCHVENIVLVRVVEPLPAVIGGGSYATTSQEWEVREADRKRLEGERKASAQDYLNQVANRLKHNGAKLEPVVLVGKVADKLADFAEKNRVDLVLIATHGRSGISRWVRGSIADRVLRSSQVPVLMVRAPGSVTGVGD